MRTRTVETSDVSREAILCQLIVTNSIVRVDTLVNKVPDTATNTHLRAFHSLPILAQVTHSVTHSVCILAHEVRLIGVWMVHIRSNRTRCSAAPVVHCRVHDRVNISALSLITG